MPKKALKKYRITVQEEAFEELWEIRYFISQDSSHRARQFVRSLKKKIKSLENFPHRGSPVHLKANASSSLPKYRFIVHAGYVIIYQVSEKEVVVLHVFGPGQDWKRSLLNASQ